MLAPCHCRISGCLPIPAWLSSAYAILVLVASPPPSLRIFFPNLEHDPGGGTAPCSRGGRNRARGESPGGAPSCPGQLPKGVLMDAQTVIAVCELLLVVVALIDLVGRRDE